MSKFFKILGKIIIVILSIPVVLSIILFIFWSIIGTINQAKIKPNFEEKLELRQEVVEKIKLGEIQLDGKRAILPQEYSSVADSACVYVYASNEEETLIEFLYKGGLTDEDQCFIYSSGGEEIIDKYIRETTYYFKEEYIDNWYFIQYR